MHIRGLHRLIVWVSLRMLVVGCSMAALACSGPRREKNDLAGEVLAHVGAYEIPRRHLELRAAHAEVYYPGTGKPEVALAQLIQGYLAAEILRAHGIMLDRAACLAEVARIERETRDAATWLKVKMVYGKDQESLLRVGILPDFAQSRLYRFYRAAPEFTRVARERASTFIDAVEKTPARFADEAARRGAAVQRVVLDARRGILPVTQTAGVVANASDSASSFGAALATSWQSYDADAAKALLDRLRDMALGRVYPNTLETPEAFVAVRLIQRIGSNQAEVELATFAKPEFGSWFWGEAKKIPISVRDPILKASFQKTISWSRELRFKP